MPHWANKGTSDEWDVWFNEERSNEIDYDSDDDECDHEKMNDPYEKL